MLDLFLEMNRRLIEDSFTFSSILLKLNSNILKHHHLNSEMVVTRICDSRMKVDELEIYVVFQNM